MISGIHTINPQTAIQSAQDYWRVPGVNYRNGVYIVDLAKTLLDSGNAKTQDD